VAVHREIDEQRIEHEQRATRQRTRVEDAQAARRREALEVVAEAALARLERHDFDRSSEQRAQAGRELAGEALVNALEAGELTADDRVAFGEVVRPRLARRARAATGLHAAVLDPLEQRRGLFLRQDVVHYWAISEVK